METFTYPSQSDTSSKAGGLRFAVPSKGTFRKPKKQNLKMQNHHTKFDIIPNASEFQFSTGCYKSTWGKHTPVDVKLWKSHSRAGGGYP